MQNIHIKNSESVNSLKNENNEEALHSSDLKRIRNFGSLTEETCNKRIFKYQSGHLISSKLLTEDVYTNDIPFRVSTKHFKTDYNPKTGFRRNWEMKRISTPDFHQQRSCETYPFNYTDESPSKEIEMMGIKSNCSSSLEEELTKHFSDAALRKTNLEINDISTKANFSMNTNCLPVSEKSDKKGNEKSERKLTESLSFPEVAAQPVNESISLVDKVIKSIESTEDANTTLRPSESNSDIITPQNRQYDSDLAPGEFAFKRKPDNNLSNTSGITYECDKCKEKCFNRTSFIRHYKSHSAKNLIVCSNSQKVISHEDQIERKRTHTHEKPFACNICKKRFTSKRYLNQHYITHSNKRPFVCDKCTKAFKRKIHLTQHYRIHTNEKPFVCDVCEKRFSRKSYLVKHYRTHTSEEP